MGYMALPRLPDAPESSENKILYEYLKKLSGVLTQWQTTLANTHFLGAAGNLTIDTTVPVDTDGEDGDIWIKT